MRDSMLCRIKYWYLLLEIRRKTKTKKKTKTVTLINFHNIFIRDYIVLRIPR